MLTENELKSLGEEGFLAGPGETEESFVKRVDMLKARSFKKIDEKTLESWDPNCQAEYCANPSWIPMTFSNKGLLPWQGAALWIFGDHVPLIQLRKGFKKGKYLIYSKEEVLKHETLHALRVAFNEPRFEEILAYQSSTSKWRRFLGPLFRKPMHAVLFLTLIFISLLIQTTSLFFISSPYLPLIKAVSLLPLVDLVFRFAMLIKDRRALNKTLEKLCDIFPRRKAAFPIAIRLKDSEIQKFASLPIEGILKYFEEMVPKSVRIRQILAQFC